MTSKLPNPTGGGPEQRTALPAQPIITDKPTQLGPLTSPISEPAALITGVRRTPPPGQVRPDSALQLPEAALNDGPHNAVDPANTPRRGDNRADQTSTTGGKPGRVAGGSGDEPPPPRPPHDGAAEPDGEGDEGNDLPEGLRRRIEAIGERVGELVRQDPEEDRGVVEERARAGEVAATVRAVSDAVAAAEAENLSEPAAAGPIDRDPPYPSVDMNIPPDDDPRGYNLWLMKLSASEFKFRTTRSIEEGIAGEEGERQLAAVDNIIAVLDAPEVRDSDIRAAVLDNREMFPLVESEGLTVDNVEQLEVGLYRMDGKPSIEFLQQLPDFRDEDGEVGFLQINDQWFMQISLPQFRGDDDVEFDSLIAVPFLGGGQGMVQRDIHSHPGDEYLLPSLDDIVGTRHTLDGTAHVVTRQGVVEIRFPTELPGGQPLEGVDSVLAAWDHWLAGMGQVDEDLSEVEYNMLHRRFLQDFCGLRVIPWSDREEIEMILGS